jgi:hypothetical protein
VKRANEMKVDDLLDIAGDYLQEDYVTSPVWTKAQLLECVRQVYRQFCALTGLVDRSEIRLISGTTGEADVPKDFESLYFAQYEQTHLDIAELDELDFVSGTWLGGTTGTPKAVSVIGSGDNAVVRYVPVPSGVWDGGTASADLDKTVTYMRASTAHRFQVWANNGVLYLEPVAWASPYGELYIRVPGVGNSWEVRLTSDGELYTNITTEATSNIAFPDGDVSGVYWSVSCTADGELVTSPENSIYGLGVGAMIDSNIWQDFDSEYGVVVDMYADGAATSPDYVGRMNSYRGLSLYAYTSDDTGMLWYKGSLPELGSVHGELVLSEGFIPVVLHGVLSMAYGLNGDGQDLHKAGLLSKVFVAECEAIRRGFEFRWA